MQNFCITSKEWYANVIPYSFINNFVRKNTYISDIYMIQYTRIRYKHRKCNLMEYLFTERAHLMCPDMNFGIALKVKAEFDAVRIRRSFLTLAGAHPFLNALIGYDEKKNAYFYDIKDSSKVEINIQENELTSLDSLEIISEYESMTGYDWNLLNRGMLKASVWKMGRYTCFLLVFHHLLTDGRGALNLAKELAAVYADNVMPEDAPEKLISSVNDLPKDSRMPLVNKMLIDNTNRNWTIERNKPLTYKEYHEFAEDFVKSDRIVHYLKKTDKDEMSRIMSSCRDTGITINDLLLAKMYINEGIDKITVASDVRDKFDFCVPGSLGNFSTSFSVVVKKKSRDPYSLAKEVHKAVHKYISKPSEKFLMLQYCANLYPEILDAAFMASRNAYKSKSAAFIGKTIFGFGAPDGYSITNLGKIESSNISAAFFIPPASPAMKKTQGVLTVNGKMMICTSER